MNKDVLELLNEIAETTFNIRKLYHKLYDNLTSEKPDKELTTYLTNLIISKKVYEDDLYSYLEEIPLDLLRTYNYLYQMEQKSFKNMDEDSRLC